MSIRDSLRRLDPAGRALGEAPPARKRNADRYDEPFELLEYRHGAGSPYGVVEVHAESIDPVAVGWLAKTEGLDAVPPQEWAFLDTETTGLAGGAGTVAFLVGIGRFEGAHFMVRQYLIRDYPEELQMLSAVVEALTDARVLVTYNGKSFDVPLLRDRCAMQRDRWPYDHLPHVDLVHLVRRLWRLRLPDARLQTVEEQLLGFERADDLPGWMVPEQFFASLRTGNRALLDPVLEHNKFDILALAALTVLASEVGRDPLRASVVETEDLLQIGRALEAIRTPEAQARARACFAEAADAVAAETAEDATWRLALLAKRRGDWVEACGHWERLLGAEWGTALSAMEELAKAAEHRSKDLDDAERWCRRALERLTWEGRDRDRRTHVERWEMRFSHRLARVIRRNGRS